VPPKRPKAGVFTVEKIGGFRLEVSVQSPDGPTADPTSEIIYKKCGLYSVFPLECPSLGLVRGLPPDPIIFRMLSA